MIDPRTLGVYVVTSGAFGPDRDHRSLARAAIEGGATAVQLRAPELDDAALLPIAGRAVPGMSRRGGAVRRERPGRRGARRAVPRACMSARPTIPQRARRRLGPDRVLGVSVGNAAKQLRRNVRAPTTSA